MKTITLLSVISIIITGFSACKSSIVKPKQVTNSLRSDTSSALIANTSIVGTWDIVTDTISDQIDTVIYGKPGDHYKFTKYGNVYTNRSYSREVDTGIYTISHSDTLRWAISYVNQFGVPAPGEALVGPFVISNLTNTSMVLTQPSFPSPAGYFRYEQITLKKEE